MRFDVFRKGIIRVNLAQPRLEHQRVRVHPADRQLFRQAVFPAPELLVNPVVAYLRQAAALNRREGNEV